MLLALDTSGPFCSAAIVEGEDVLCIRSEELGRGHAERLMPMLVEMLVEAELNWNNIDQIACTTGPGSFTGLRVGLASARGLALALDCPCHGISVFEAMAHNQDMPLVVVMDAKRDQLWMQVFNKDGLREGEPIAVAIENASKHIPSKIQNLAGSGAPILAVLDKRFKIITDTPSPPIEGVARCALTSKSKPSTPKPLYLRAPDAKPQKPAVMNS